MKCNVCGQNYSSPSLGGAGICPRCDCGIAPDGHKWSIEESLDISNRYRRGQMPYYSPDKLTKELAVNTGSDTKNSSSRLPSKSLRKGQL